jgi:hypothetical protein
MEQIPGEQKEEAPIRNLKTNPADTIRAMAEVEGPEWFGQQPGIKKGVSGDGEYETSLSNALERLEQEKTSTIYGRHGINRWQIKKDGTVVFSESHAASPDHLAKARDLGFEIVP